VPASVPLPELTLENGVGGFTPDGREYVIVLDGDRETPLPWSNVIANPEFGTMLSAAGSGFTWAANSRENRLTPFANDPVGDPTGEAIYLRDDASGESWGATPGPLARRPDGGRWVVRHAPGITRYQHAIDGLTQELTVFVAPDDPVKVAALTLTNTSTTPRRVSVFGYVEWCLGPPRGDERRLVVSEFDAAAGALLARNPYNTEFAGQVAFWQATEPVRSYTADRGEFIGRGRTLRHPAALHRATLGGRVGPALDPCGALQVTLDLEPGETRRVAFVLGCGSSRTEAVDLARRYASLDACEAAYARSDAMWEETLGAIQVKTPDDSFDLIVNRWLPYQTLSCRIWARSGPSQPGGAFGFRDQLQDVLALLYTRPDLCREHLLRAAAPVRRGRRAALVAPAVGARHAHAVLRRPAVAALRAGGLRLAHRRRHGARRDGALPRSVRSSSPTRPRPTTSRASRPSARRSSSTRCAPSRTRCDTARTACRSSGRATGTTG
jgi:cyclic beta-1,2-glucan synthetase